MSKIEQRASPHNQPTNFELKAFYRRHISVRSSREHTRDALFLICKVRILVDCNHLVWWNGTIYRSDSDFCICRSQYVHQHVEHSADHILYVLTVLGMLCLLCNLSFCHFVLSPVGIDSEI